jgi:hypothetical protein
MKKIYAQAFNDHIGYVPEVLKAISYLPEEKQERFVELCVDCEITIDELPKKIRRSDVVYTLVSCNYLEDDIKASYIDTDVRYFATENEAIEYSNSGKYIYSKSEYKETAEYPYKGEYTHEKESYFSFRTWMSSEVVVANDGAIVGDYE